MTERFFYHSFPLSRAGADPIERGLTILASMANMGLLLTPEITEWSENLADGSLSEPWMLAQKRICFTELAPGELPLHAEKFGPFALEFEIKVLRRVGIVPVFYLPRAEATTDGFAGIGSTMLARLAEVQTLLERLEGIATTTAAEPNKHKLLNVTRNQVEVGTTRCSVGAAEDLLAVLQAQIQPVEALVAAMRAISGLIYPIDDARRTDELEYYRQREWRLISAMSDARGDQCQDVPPEEQAFLVQMNRCFFGKKRRFPTGEHTIASQCKKLAQFDGKHVLELARRLIAPAAAEQRATGILGKRGINLAVESA